jgi:hypothetical protein
MANSVQVVISPPDTNSVKRGSKVPTTDIKYVAAFRREASGRKPVHVGPSIWVNVVDDDGKILRTDACTLAVNDKGKGELEAVLRRVKSVECSAETEVNRDTK